jgi:hypothetical protein
MALHIDVETSIPVILIHVIVKVGKVSELGPSTVRHENIQAAHLLYRFGHQALNVGSLCQIGLDREESGAIAILLGRSLTSYFFQLSYHLGGAIGAAMVVDDNTEIWRQDLGDSGTQASRGRSDKSNFHRGVIKIDDLSMSGMNGVPESSSTIQYAF